MFSLLMAFRCILVVVVGMGLLMGCASSKPTIFNKPTNTTTYENYDEDLSAVRPRYKESMVAKTETISKKPETNTVISSTPLHINRQLDDATDAIAEKNKAFRYAAGYRIQIYVGNVRQEADNARLFTYQTFPELNPYLTYSPPTYRIRIGDFMTRMDAERYLQPIKQQYPSAVIIADRIELKKSLLTK